ncbi:bifunctional 4-hydroxy-2-oxoglutarate aldolase/2-dehydro-3-deoxy-phosphogluconate aldolase [Leptolyngbya sp. BC1307]|uniref:bifunctional 4-hydroxy-2-oxoglutarate aldolase/2-dehydro-3-deoxy-phosphogluconate aldolase n=1 Tax=Leptolyngbya sp. BC1307 TaxID=2029589 RepID=UPI000EFAD841|nr:bifunctional 4-hydroxy-2-oxoglutarate aldolase/2-dehydro-3-deoxy-phosphogluconate aldolase [Leptolyngbya sp. BC1307]
MGAKSGDRVRAQWLALLVRYRAIAIIRAPDVKIGLMMAKAAAAGGFGLIEVAWNNAQPAAMMAAIRQALPDCVVGVGTVLSAEDLTGAIAAQAQFCFTPHTDCQLIRLAQTHSLPMIAGAMTPTEIITAWRAGAASVKVFPIAALGNGDYIRSVLGPLGPIPLVPTGGVTSESAPDLIAAGAIAVGLSTALFPKTEVAQSDWGAIETRSRYLLTLLKKP